MSTQAPGVVPASIHSVAPWASESDIPEGRITDSNGNAIADIQLGWMIAAATDLLYVLSGRKWRQGHSVVRPCALNRSYVVGSMVYPFNSISGYGYGWGFAAGWQWSLLGLGFSQGADASEITLQGPITSIEQILLNGSPLNPATDYTVYDRRRVVLSAGLSWPWEQDPQQPPTAQGTASITYDWGSSPPEIGRLACVELAIELALSFSGQDKCRLPSRVVSVASQGVTETLGDALQYILQDLTALPICDMFLQSSNPQKARRRSVFWGPNTLVPRTQ